jgi:hypothetical protein
MMRQPGRKKFRLRDKLLSLDSTSIDLCASLYDWAKYKRTKGAAKVHLLLDNEGYLPVFACITDGKSHDATVGRQMRFARRIAIHEDGLNVAFAGKAAGRRRRRGRIGSQGIGELPRTQRSIRFPGRSRNNGPASSTAAVLGGRREWIGVPVAGGIRPQTCAQRRALCNTP